MDKTLTKVLLTRLIKIDSLIKQGYIHNDPVNKRSLAEELEISEKTIQRDIEYMKTEYDAPIEYNRKTRNLYYSKQFTLSPLSLNESDFFMLAVTEKVLNQYKGTLYENRVKTFFNKINSLFDNKEMIQLEDVDELVSFNLGPVKELNKGVFDIIEKAIRYQRTIKVDYTSLKEKKRQKREFNPYHLRNYKGDWYIIGYDYTKKSIRVLNLLRINSAEYIGRKKFVIIENFDINSYFKFSFGNYIGKKVYEVKIRFSPGLSPRIKEKIWHHTQEIKEFKNGSIILSFKLNSTKEIKKWILQWGKECVVLSPKELHAEMKKEIKEMNKEYNKQ